MSAIVGIVKAECAAAAAAAVVVVCIHNPPSNHNRSIGRRIGMRIVVMRCSIYVVCDIVFFVVEGEGIVMGIGFVHCLLLLLLVVDEDDCFLDVTSQMPKIRVVALNLL
jgi:hypothetical protein